MTGRPWGSKIEAQEGSDVTSICSRTATPRHMMLGLALSIHASSRAAILTQSKGTAASEKYRNLGR
jgi:hypothetical protein